MVHGCDGARLEKAGLGDVEVPITVGRKNSGFIPRLSVRSKSLLQTTQNRFALYVTV